MDEKEKWQLLKLRFNEKIHQLKGRLQDSPTNADEVVM